MITLLTGVPGSGKTLYAVQLAEKYLSEGRDVYSDIDGYNRALLAPDDWRNCPTGSIIIYDECQKRFPAVGRGRSKDEVITAMEEHRHLGIDIVLISQRPQKIHHDVRAVVGLHHHFLRVYGLERAKVFTKDSLIVDTLSSYQLRECDQRFWSFPKSLYTLYKSADVHTHKAYMPRFVLNALIVVVICLFAIGYLFRSSHNFFSSSSESLGDKVYSTESLPGQGLSDLSISDSHKQDGPLELKPLLIDKLSSDYLRSLSACLKTNIKCVCYDKDFFVIDQSYDSCFLMLSKLPVYVRRQVELSSMSLDDVSHNTSSSESSSSKSSLVRSGVPGS